MDLISPYYMDMCIEGDKVYACGLFGVVNYSLDRGQTWQIRTTYTDEMLNSITSFGNTVITAGTGGIIRYSNDGGKNWGIPEKIVTATIKSVVLIDELNAIAVGNLGVILKTSNGGKSWTQIFGISTSSDIFSAFVTESKKILIATIDGQIYKSDDYGENWIEINIPIGFINPRKFTYSFDKVIYLLTDNVLLKSIDEGETWIYYSNPIRKSDFCSFTENGNGFIGGAFYNSKLLRMEKDTSVVDTINVTEYYGEIFKPAFKDLKYFDKKNAIAVGVYGAIFSTEDAGKTWKQISYFYTYPPNGQISAIYFINDSIGFMGTDRESLYKTTNKGNTWNYIRKDKNRGELSSISSIFFFDENVGMLKSEQWDGTLLITYDGGLNFIRDTVSRQLNGATFGFDLLYDSTFFFIGWRYFYNVWHTYYGLREFNGSWLNKGVFDSCQLASRYFLRNKIFLSGYFIDSCKLPEEPYMYYRGLIVKSEDNCKTWKKTFFDTIDVIRSVEFVDDSLGYAFSNSYINGIEDSTIVFRTTDGGESWHFFSNDTNIIRKIAILRNHNGKYAIGYGKNKKYLFTTDYGATWSPLPISTSYTIMGIYATDNYFYLKGICGTYNIMIRMKLKDEYISVKEETQSLPAPLAYMSLPYPNPANEYTNFDIVWDKRYDINENSFSITNVFGQKFDNPKLEILGRNDNRATIRWNTNGIPAGLYIFKLELDGYQRVQKVVLNK
jgi:photosystem II stability/assembly factor-like uncharacterized protein